MLTASEPFDESVRLAKQHACKRGQDISTGNLRVIFHNPKYERPISLSAGHIMLCTMPKAI